MRVLTFLAFLSPLLGYGYLSGLDEFRVPFFCCGFALLGGTLARTMKTTHDWFNPLAILFFSALVRIGLPALLLVFAHPPYDWVWDTLPDENWEMGVGLALIGLTSIVLGWLTVPRGFMAAFEGTIGKFAGDEAQVGNRVGIVALLFFLVGIVFTIAFMRMNYADPVQAVNDGSLRNPELVQSGTSRYIFLGQWMMTAGPLVWCGHLLFTRRLRWFEGLLPVICAGMILTPFGGRVGALTPVLCGLIVLWYREPRNMGFLRLLAMFAVLFLFVQMYAAFVVFYRGNGLENGWCAFDWDVLKEHLEMSIWGEIGILHPYAHATNYEPGILEGRTFPVIIIDNFAGFDTIRPGVFLTQDVFSPNVNWGIHTGLIVDLYMNAGLVATIAGCICFGAIWRSAYETLRARRESPNIVVLYVIFLWYSIWIFYESMILLNTLFFALFFAKAVYVAARLSMAKPADLLLATSAPLGSNAPPSGRG